MSNHFEAVLIELLSVVAAHKRLKEPIKIPRPGDAAQQQRPQRQPVHPKTPTGGSGGLDSAYKQGIGVLAASSKKVRR